MYWLEQGVPLAGMQVGARGNAQPADQPRTKIG